MTMQKKGRDKIRLVLDAFTPNTLPMARLAEYLRELASVLGNEANVHFDRVEKSSASLVSYSESTVTPKIRQRLEEVIEGSAPKPAMKAKSAIDDMLVQDNGMGFIELNDLKVIQFSGKNRAPQQRIGPVRRKSFIDGQIFQIGGKDETINVYLRNVNKANETYRAEVSIDLARRLAPYFLLGRVRLFGEGDWYRTDSGWTINPNTFTAFDFELIDESNLSRTINSARQIFSDVEADGALWEKLRHE